MRGGAPFDGARSPTPTSLRSGAAAVPRAPPSPPPAHEGGGSRGHSTGLASSALVNQDGCAS